MLFSLSWLKDYVDLPEVSTISERLTRAGSEVERVLEQDVDFEGVMVAAGSRSSGRIPMPTSCSWPTFPPEARH